MTVMTVHGTYAILGNSETVYKSVSEVIAVSNYTKNHLKSLRLDATEHEIEFQMTIRAAKLGIAMAEIPTIELVRIGGKG